MFLHSPSGFLGLLEISVSPGYCREKCQSLEKSVSPGYCRICLDAVRSLPIFGDRARLALDWLGDYLAQHRVLLEGAGGLGTGVVPQQIRQRAKRGCHPRPRSGRTCRDLPPLLLPVIH